MVSTTAQAAAHETGLPPKVEAWSPGTKPVGAASETRSAPIGERFAAQLPETRGAGLLLAVELHRQAGPVAYAALEHNLLVGTAGDTALRITPPLTITDQEADLAVDLLRETLR